MLILMMMVTVIMVILTVTMRMIRLIPLIVFTRMVMIVFHHDKKIFQVTRRLKPRIISFNQQILFTWLVGHECGWPGQLITLVI